jgi:prepilin-type N-terminal cleavage/methylation domain-containing protein
VSSKKGFTLIELLIVVAIIGILAAIAIPNFLMAQTRAKVSRVKAEFRTIATGIEAYSLDWNTYPSPMLYANIYYVFANLTTPVDYLTTIHEDPFGLHKSLTHVWTNAYEYGAGKEGEYSSQPGGGYAQAMQSQFPNDCWLLESMGPDGVDQTYDFAHDIYTSWFPWLASTTSGTPGDFLALLYDPTNGTISNGQIQRVGGRPLARPPLHEWYNAVTSQ